MNAIKIAYLFDPTTEMTSYARKRAEYFQQQFDQAIHFFTKAPVTFHAASTTYTTQPELHRLLSDYEPTLVIRDAGRSAREDIQFLHLLGSRVAVIDDSGDGAMYADLQLQTLYTEDMETSEKQVRLGLLAYIPVVLPEPVEAKRKAKRIVIAFPEKDPENLTHRLLRHLALLHVPLEVDVVIHPQYQHDRFSLQAFCLQRKHIQLIETDDCLPFLATADLAVTSSAHMPYLCLQTATPAVLLAETKREVGYRFGDELDAFTHLGLGRKIKQSALQNAVMEVVLHDALLSRKKQQLEKLASSLHPEDLLLELRTLAELREFTS